MTPNDKRIINTLAKGKTHAQTSQELKLKGYAPNSVSHIEKLLKSLKKEHKATTFFQLAVKLTKKGIIK